MNQEGMLLHRYKDDATAFNAKKRGSWKDKGKTNATMSAAIFAYLEGHGVPTHFVEQGDMEAIPGVHKFTINCNWKFPSDNTPDHYHGATTHLSATIAGH